MQGIQQGIRAIDSAYRLLDLLVLFTSCSPFHTLLETDLIFFQQVQWHYHKVNTTLQGWNCLEYHTLTSPCRSNEDEIFLVDRKTSYHLNLAIVRRKS